MARLQVMEIKDRVMVGKGSRRKVDLLSVGTALWLVQEDMCPTVMAQVVMVP